MLPGALLLNNVGYDVSTIVSARLKDDDAGARMWNVELALLITVCDENFVRQLIITARCVGWAWVVDDDIVGER